MEDFNDSNSTDKLISPQNSKRKLRLIFLIIFFCLSFAVYSFFALSEEEQKQLEQIHTNIEQLSTAKTLDLEQIIYTEEMYQSMSFRMKFFVKDANLLNEIRYKYYQQEADNLTRLINNIEFLTIKKGYHILEILEMYNESPTQIQNLVDNSEKLFHAYESYKSQRNQEVLELADMINLVELDKFKLISEARKENTDFMTEFGEDSKSVGIISHAEVTYEKLVKKQVELIINKIDTINIESEDYFFQIYDAMHQLNLLRSEDQILVTNLNKLEEATKYFDKMNSLRVQKKNKSYYEEEIGNVQGLDEKIVDSMVIEYTKLYDKIFVDYSNPISFSEIEDLGLPAKKVGFTENQKWQDEYSPIYNLYLITLGYRYNSDYKYTKKYEGGLFLSGDSAYLGFEKSLISKTEQETLGNVIDEHCKLLQTKINKLDSPIEKAIKIAHHFSYIKYDDVAGNVSGVNNHLYSALIKDMTQCNGYAVLMSTFLDKFDVDSELIAGNIFNTLETISYNGDNFPHIWNLVKVGEKWYHLDLTWYYDYVKVLVGESAFDSDDLVITESNYDSRNLFFASNKQIKDYQIVDNVGRYFLLDKRVNPAEDEALPYTFEEYNKIYAFVSFKYLYDELYARTNDRDISALDEIEDLIYLSSKPIEKKKDIELIIKQLQNYETILTLLNAEISDFYTKQELILDDYQLEYFLDSEN